MSTKILSDGLVHDYFNPYQSPYDAFINYMNVLSDFSDLVNEVYENLIPIEPKEILQKIKDYEAKIQSLYKELKKTLMIEKAKPIFAAIEKTKDELKALTSSKKIKPVKKKITKKPVAKKPAAKKSASSSIKKTTSTKKNTGKK